MNRRILKWAGVLLRELLKWLSSREDSDASKTRLVANYQLVKFDGEPPAPGEMKEPVEILEGSDTESMRTTYRAGQGPVRKLYTADPATGDAVLAKEIER